MFYFHIFFQDKHALPLATKKPIKQQNGIHLIKTNVQNINDNVKKHKVSLFQLLIHRNQRAKVR